MKLAILSPFFPYRGGIAQFSGRLYQELEKDCNVKAFSFTRLYPSFLFPGKTQYVEDDDVLNIPNIRVVDSINPFSYRKTAKAIQSFAPDVLIIAYWMSFFAPAYRYIARRLRKNTRIVALVHNAIPHEPRFFDKFFAKYFFKHVDEFIVMSDSVKADVLSLMPNAEIIQTPHPLYDHYGDKLSRQEAESQLAIAPGKKTLLFFGLIRDYKGLDLLISAMDYLDDSYRLLIAGECYGSFGKYQDLIDKSGACDRIHVFNHYISDKNVPVFFSAADLLVLPYRSATQSGVVPVAYHFDLPILSTDVGGLKDTIQIPETGIVVSPDPRSIAGGIEQFFVCGSEVFVKNIQIEKEKLSWSGFISKLFV